MTKLQTQGVHHITLVGADRQTSVDFWAGRARHAARVRAAQPRRPRDQPPLLRSRRRPPDHRLHPGDVQARRAAQSDGRRQPAPPGLHGVARHLHAGQDAARGARLLQLRRGRPRLHVLDLLPRSAGPAAGARLLQVRAADGRTRMPTCCARPTTSASPRAPTTSPTSTWPTPSSCCRASRPRPPPRCPEEHRRLSRSRETTA